MLYKKLYKEIIIMHTAEVHSEPSQTSKTESLLQKRLTIFAKNSVLGAAYIRFYTQDEISTH